MTLSLGRKEARILRSSRWPGEASAPSFSPEKTILQQAIWFTRGATDEHLVLSLAWMGAKSEEEKNNNNAARGCQARACTRCDRHWAEPLALLHLIFTTRTVGLVTPHSADGESEAQGGDKAAGKRQDQDVGPGLPDTPRGPGSRSPLTGGDAVCPVHASLPATASTRKGGSLKRNHMARIPGFHRDTQEQDLISQLLLWLKIFTSKYILICHIFASSKLGVFLHQPGGGEAWWRRVLPSGGADDNHVNILEGWLVCQSQSPPP